MNHHGRLTRGQWRGTIKPSVPSFVLNFESNTTSQNLMFGLPRIARLHALLLLFSRFCPWCVEEVGQQSTDTLGSCARIVIVKPTLSPGPTYLPPLRLLARLIIASVPTKLIITATIALVVAVRIRWQCITAISIVRTNERRRGEGGGRGGEGKKGDQSSLIWNVGYGCITQCRARGDG